MTDSSIEKNSGEGSFDTGPSMEELFGDIEEESLEGEKIDRQEDDPGDDEEIEDLTAADVFNQLRDEVSANDGADTVLEEASPEDIIASADEPVTEEEQIDGDLVDEGALDNLLLTGRTKGEEFLWVDSGDSTETDSSESTDTSAGLSEIDDDADGDESAVSTEGHAADVTESSEHGDETTDSHAEELTDRGAPDRTGQDVEVVSQNETLDTEPTPQSTTESGVSTAESEASAAESEASTAKSTETDSAGRRDYSLESSADEEENTAAADTKDDTATTDVLEDGDETGGEIVLSDVEKTDTEMVPAEDDEGSGGFFAWIRSKLPF
ncbi:hypothetical protein OB919_08290 [Halobacteria archaeon AArc-curdl1]|uniref:Uncharacterized protein n=1 Tax=Natronosalvus hydrolyticus TaxID=2979988 RepID=A0AAP2Z8H6_9EURY|nr:hypothetical protein [Halobacteria archaeon AArc-curdl1]